MYTTEANVIDVANTRDLRAEDVLADVLINYASKELEEHYASQWEEENCKALIRSWEELENGKFAGTYQQRRSHFEAKAKREAKPPLAFSCAPEIAKDELEKFNRMPLSEIVAVTKTTVVENGKEKTVERQLMVEKINGYRAILDMPPFDPAQLAKKIEGPDYETKAAEFLKMTRNERLQAVRTLTDRTLLGYIIADDPDGEIRATAQGRLLELAVG
jgi:hypothetical protein